MRTSSLEIWIVNVSFCGTTLIVGCCPSDERFVFMSFRQYTGMSLYISFTLMSKPHIKSLFESLRPSLVISVLSESILLGSFIIFTENFKFVDFCVGVTIMGVSVRASFDALKCDSHAESVRLDRYGSTCIQMCHWNDSTFSAHIYDSIVNFPLQYINRWGFLSYDTTISLGWYQAHAVSVLPREILL